MIIHTVKKNQESSQCLVMNQHLLVIFVYVHQRYNTYWYVETDFFFFMYTIDRGKNSCIYFFCRFFFLIVFLPHTYRSAFTSKLQQLYKEGRPRKVRSGKHVVGRSETGYQLGFFSSFFFKLWGFFKKKEKKRHISVEKDKLEDKPASSLKTLRQSVFRFF